MATIDYSVQVNITNQSLQFDPIQSVTVQSSTTFQYVSPVATTTINGIGLTYNGNTIVGGTITGFTDVFSTPPAAAGRSISVGDVTLTPAQIYVNLPFSSLFSGNDVFRSALDIISNDTIAGGGGNDTIIAGAGTDTAVYSGSRASYAVTAAQDGSVLVVDRRGGSPDGTDVLIGVELLQFSDGTIQAPVFSGGPAAPEAPEPPALPSTFPLSLVGTSDPDTLSGGAGNDLILGNLGDDVLFGRQGSDTLFGGQGQDALYGGQDADLLLGNLGNDILFGNLGNDTLYGGQGADTLYGGQGDDVLFGDLGDDVLYGDLGNDVLRGGAGSDRYVFNVNSGNDVVLGFSVAEGDRLDLRGQTYTFGTAADGSGSALLVLSGGGTIQLAGVTQGQVNASFFAS